MTFTLECALLFHCNWCLEHNSSVRGRYTRKEWFDLRMVSIYILHILYCTMVMKLEIILVTPTTSKFLQNRYPYRDCLTSKNDTLNGRTYRIPNVLSATPTPVGKNSLFTILNSWTKDKLLAIKFAFPLTTMSYVISSYNRLYNTLM